MCNPGVGPEAFPSSRRPHFDHIFLGFEDLLRFEDLLACGDFQAEVLLTLASFQPVLAVIASLHNGH